jgi:spore coat polysaccharide biosynthesis protein SpsF
LPIPIYIFARMSSRRLPGKAMRDIAGRPMLARVIERCLAARRGAGVVVVTSDRADDDAIVSLVAGSGASVFRGSLDDVLGRAVACAAAGGHEDFVRISGDSPFIDPEIIDLGIDTHERLRPDLTTNTTPRTCPPGLSVEVVHAATLARALREGATVEDREHVTPWVYRHAAMLRIESFAPAIAFPSGVRLTVDTEAQLAIADMIARRMPAPYATAPTRLAAEYASEIGMKETK